MKIIQEYLYKICITIFILAILMEFYIYFLLAKRAPNIFNNIYNETIIKAEKKSAHITNTFQLYANNLLIKYLADLKLICKHSLLLNGKKVYNADKVANQNSNFFNINKNNKNIIIATQEELNKEKYIEKYYNSTTNNYDYINIYEKYFKDIHDNNLILKELFSDSHKELNTIGYYRIRKKNIDFTKDEEMKAKFIISILKTVFINRYISKRKNLDYIRFYLFNKDEIYIYPPEAYNNTNFFNSENAYIISNCNFSKNNDNAQQQFPLCIYNYIINYLMKEQSNFPSFIINKVIYEKVICSLCLKIPFIKNNPEQAIICLEIAYTNLFNDINFIVPQKVQIGLFTIYMDAILPLINNDKNIYNEIKNTFKDFEIEKYK